MTRKSLIYVQDLRSKLSIVNEAKEMHFKGISNEMLSIFNVPFFH